MSSNKNRTHPYLRTSVSAVALLVGAGVFAVPVTATAGEIADLCGTTITEHVTIVDVSDSYGSTCNITIADKASLTLKGSSFTVGGGPINIDATAGNGFIDLRGGSSLSASSVRLETGWGDISVRDSDLSAGSDIDLRSDSGDISVKSSTLSADSGGVDLNSSSGDVTVLDGSILDAGGNGMVGIFGEDVTVKGNELYTSGGNVQVDADDELKFIGNLVDAWDDSVVVSLRGGDTVIVKQNTFEVEASNSGAVLRVENDTEGTIEFKDNVGWIDGASEDAYLEIDGTGASDLDVRNNDIDLSGSEPNEVLIRSDTGDLTVKDNMFDGADTATASTTGNCTSVNNTPTITCT